MTKPTPDKIQTNAKKRGRPTLQKQFENEAIITKKITEGRLPMEIAEETGYNYRTVYKYYNRYLAKARDEIGKNFIEQQQEAKKNCVAKLEEIISRKEALIKKLEDHVHSHKKINIGITRTLGQLYEELSIMEQQKESILMEPTLDVKLEEIISKEARGEAEPTD